MSVYITVFATPDGEVVGVAQHDTPPTGPVMLTIETADGRPVPMGPAHQLEIDEGETSARAWDLHAHLEIRGGTVRWKDGAPPGLRNRPIRPRVRPGRIDDV